MKSMIHTRRFVLICLFLMSSTAMAQSPEYSQGPPHRDFKSDATGLATAWPTSGPRRLRKL